MRTIDWELMGPVLGQVLFNITIMTLVVTLFGTFVMKHFVRTVPLLSRFHFLWGDVQGDVGSRRHNLRRRHF